MAQIICRYCGVSVEAHTSNQFRCGSADCLRQYNREATAKTRAKQAAELPPKTCRQCGGPFPRTEGNKQYCSPECQRVRHLERRRDREYQPAARTCDFCSGEIPYKSGKRRYCSAECQKAGIAKEARWRVKGLSPDMVMPTACALCGVEGRRLVIDHDHLCCPGGNTCGKCFRGMLCQPCNVALGMFREDVDLLRRAVEYIETAKERHATHQRPTPT